MGNLQILGISDWGCYYTVGHSAFLGAAQKSVPTPCLHLKINLRVTDHAAVADIGYIELFDILNINYTNYTRGYDHLMVWYHIIRYNMPLYNTPAYQTQPYMWSQSRRDSPVRLTTAVCRGDQGKWQFAFCGNNSGYGSPLLEAWEFNAQKPVIMFICIVNINEHFCFASSSYNTTVLS